MRLESAGVRSRTRPIPKSVCRSDHRPDDSRIDCTDEFRRPKPPRFPSPLAPAELLLAAALTGRFAAFVLGGPAPGDAPVQYRTFLVRDGALVWDKLWYAGTYPLASYSLLYYLPAGLVGTSRLVFAAAVASTVFFSSLALREWGSAALWPFPRFRRSRRGPDVHRVYAYSLGSGDARDAQAAAVRRPWRRGLRRSHGRLQPARLCLPLLIVGSYVISRRGIARRYIWFGVGLALAAGIEVAALVLSPSGTGAYPFAGSTSVPCSP